VTVLGPPLASVVVKMEVEVDEVIEMLEVVEAVEEPLADEELGPLVEGAVSLLAEEDTEEAEALDDEGETDELVEGVDAAVVEGVELGRVAVAEVEAALLVEIDVVLSCRLSRASGMAGCGVVVPGRNLRGIGEKRRCMGSEEG
ncbi:MAG: hypothetical protein M1814_002656, partial [Vezdaea aestivalis]